MKTICLFPAALFAMNLTCAAADLTVEDARAIAREAYVYGFPMVDSYRVQHAYFVNGKNPEYKGEWNVVHNTPRVYTPADKAVQTPNSDTPYSAVGLDLRTEPVVLTVPPIAKDRYFSIQFIDAYTQNFDYAGSRTTGNEGGDLLVIGPHWKGEPPPGFKKVIRSETELAMALYRTQLFNPDDLDEVKKVQAGYKAQPLSKFLGLPQSPGSPPIEFIQPLTPAEQKASPEFYNILNFVLQFCPTVPSETALMERFSKIGVGAGKAFDATKFSPQIRQAMSEGMADAWREFLEFKTTKIDLGKVTSGELFGDRAFLKDNYPYRMAAAVLGIYGNTKAEAMYPMYGIDADGDRMDGSKRYQIHFPAGKLPPVHAFWSLTMYEMPQSLLVANPINRYLINSPMLPDLQRDPDGGLTLLIQNESPGKEKESNWLPAAKGPFVMAMRLYWPKDEALSGAWKSPPLEKVR